ncbi:MAG: hypothetical protein IJ083_02680 [Clostridia bacterium]|nr:hypothetical protein [Clostridia bacterium]
MTEVGKFVTDAWAKVNEGISAAAGSLAEASRAKAREMNLINQKDALLRQIAPMVLKLYEDGAAFPEELAKLLDNLKKVQEELKSLHPVKPAPEVKEKAEEAAVPEDAADEEVPSEEPDTEETVIDVSEDAAGEDPDEAPIADVPAEAADEALEDDFDIPVVARDETAESIMETYEVDIPDEKAAASQDETPKSEETDREPEQAPEEKADQDDLQEAWDKVQKMAKETGLRVNDILDELAKKTEQAMEHVTNMAGKARSQMPESASQDIDRAMDSVGDTIGKAVEGLGRLASKAADALGGLFDAGAGSKEKTAEDQERRAPVIEVEIDVQKEDDKSDDTDAQ